MNRWMYYLIGLRFKGVGQQQMYRRPSKFRIAINIICYILSAIMLGVIFAYGGFWAFIAGGSFFGIILAFFSSMSVGKDLIYTQYLIANEQIRGERPLDFNHKLVKLGYVMSFAPVYIIMFVALLVPGGYLWFIPWFPFFVISILLAYMSAGYIEIFNYKMRKYVLCHVGVHFFIFIAGTLIRELLIVPTMK